MKALHIAAVILRTQLLRKKSVAFHIPDLSLTELIFFAAIVNTSLCYDVRHSNYRRIHMPWWQIGTRLSAAIDPGCRYQAPLSIHGKFDLSWWEFNHQQKTCPRALLLTGINLNCSMEVITCSGKCGMKLLIHSQSSTAAPLKFGDGYVTSSQTNFGYNYLSMLLRLIHVSKWGHRWVSGGRLNIKMPSYQ